MCTNMDEVDKLRRLLFKMQRGILQRALAWQVLLHEERIVDIHQERRKFPAGSKQQGAIDTLIDLIAVVSVQMISNKTSPNACSNSRAATAITFHV